MPAHRVPVGAARICRALQELPQQRLVELCAGSDRRGKESAGPASAAALKRQLHTTVNGKQAGAEQRWPALALGDGQPRTPRTHPPVSSKVSGSRSSSSPGPAAAAASTPSASGSCRASVQAGERGRCRPAGKQGARKRHPPRACASIHLARPPAASPPLRALQRQRTSSSPAHRARLGAGASGSGHSRRALGCCSAERGRRVRCSTFPGSCRRAAEREEAGSGSA